MSMTISDHISTLRKMSDECIDSSLPVEMNDNMDVGDMFPQGDIALLVIPGKLVGQEAEWGEGDFQLAPGNNKGSRHTIPSKYKDVVKIIRVSDGDSLSDLSITATGKFDLCHPEHADHIGYPAGSYRVRHQQNSQRQRVLD